MRNAYKVLVEKTVWKILLVRPRRRFKDNIKIMFEVIGFEGMDWIHLA
jgi:hypothetical protein